MKTDSIFYRLFQSLPSIFFELINQSPAEASAYEFTSCEVKQLSFRLDGLFFPKNPNPQKPFYAVEVQFQPDDDLYYRVFAELFLYLRLYKPPCPWQVVVIYPSRNIEREEVVQFGDMLLLNRVKRLYLDELESDSLGIGVVKLVIETEETAPELAKRLIEQAQQQLSDATAKRDLIELIESIIVYKLPQKSREEIEAMLGLSDLKQTKVYQEAVLETKLETIPRMIEYGLSLEAIAQLLDLPLEVVQQSVHQSSSQ